MTRTVANSRRAWFCPSGTNQETNNNKSERNDIMAKFMCTHTMSGVTQEMYSGVAAAGQKEPNDGGHRPPLQR